MCSHGLRRKTTSSRHPRVASALTRPRTRISPHHQLRAETRALKAKLLEAEMMNREEERQRKERSTKEFTDAERYRRNLMRPSLGIDPWQHRIKQTLAEQKVETQAKRGSLRRIAAVPHQYLTLPRGLSFLGRQEGRIEAVVV